MKLTDFLSSLTKPSYSECAPLPVPAGSSGGMTPVGNLNSSATASGAEAPVTPAPPTHFNDNSPLVAESVDPIIGLDPSTQPQAPIIAAPRFTADGRTNPGAFDKADQDAQRVLKPDIWDGCRFEHNKVLGPQFNVSHSLWLGSAMLPQGNNYNFGSTVVLNQGRTMMLGRMSDELRLDAQIHHEIIQPQKLIARVISSIGASSEQSVTHGSLEMNGIDYNASLKVAKGPLVAFSYFQSVTKWLNMGAEAFHHSAQGVSHVFARVNYRSLAKAKSAQPPMPSGPGQPQQQFQAPSDPVDNLNCTISTMGGMNINYVRKVSDRVSLAAELEYSLASHQTQVNIGYEFLLRQCKISGVVSTEGTIQNQIQEAIAPGFHIIFNSILDHKRDTHRFGYGVQIG